MSTEQAKIDLEIIDGLVLTLTHEQLLGLARRGVRAFIIGQEGFRVLCSKETYKSAVIKHKNAIESIDFIGE